MNEQEQQLLERYLKYVKKRRIIFIVVLIILTSAGILFLNMNLEIKSVVNEPIIETENEIENQESENVTNHLSNTISENTDAVEEIRQEEKPEIKEPVKETPKVIETSKPSTSTTSTKKEVEKSKPKPANKDFLFTDGYTMDNVTQVAQDYLKSSGYAGECIPLQDDEGIYLGMRVIFY